LKTNVDGQIAQLYGGRFERGFGDWGNLLRLRDVNRLMLLSGVVVVAGGAGITAYVVRNGFTWWSLLTGYLGFMGLGLIQGAVGGRQRVSRAVHELGQVAFELAAQEQLDPRLAPYVDRIRRIRAAAATEWSAGGDELAPDQIDTSPPPKTS
jgi:hypothetical protein